MFSYICGEIIYCGDGILIIDNHGIGYEMLISNQTSVNCHIGEQIQIFVYMQVREDGIALFGFSTEEENKCFLS
jgi:Holliday junction resolvasome, DNA-binding subunit